jgi:hypothetical protein
MAQMAIDEHPSGKDQVSSIKKGKFEVQPASEVSKIPETAQAPNEKDQKKPISTNTQSPNNDNVCPYREYISLQLEANGEAPFSSSLTANIIHKYEPSTLSCVMKVILPGHSSPMILKLYDPRYSTQLRSDHAIKPWTPLLERKLHEFILSGSVDEFLDKLRNDDDFEEPLDGWTDAENEYYLHDLALDKFRAETAVYERLRDIQGREIPKLCATVFLNLPGPAKNCDTELLVIKGILIEHISGYTITEMPSNIPRDQWQPIIDEATRVVNIISDYEVLNQDVRPDKFIISGADSSNKRVCIIDFAESRLREPDEEEHDWGRAKHRQDEGTAIGAVMAMRLRKYDFQLQYERSRRYEKWAEIEPVGLS